MKLRCLLILFLIFSFLVTPISVLANDTDDFAVTNGCHSVDAAIPFLGSDKLVDNVQSAFLYEVESQTLLYSWEADKQLYPASLVKLMTALLVFEQGKLDDVVTVTENALSSVSYDAISVDLQVGEQMTVRQLLYCMLVYSANDAAAVLAESVAGSQDGFVEQMNQKAQELGCTGTVYANAHGLHDDLQLTTARDTCRILEAVLAYEEFRTIFSTIHYTVDATNLHDARNLSSNNFLMNTDSVAIHYDDRVTGGRTGITTDGYRCVASTAKEGNMEVICVVMGCKSTYVDDTSKVDIFGGFPETSKLLDSAFDGFSRQQVIFKNQILRQQAVQNGDSYVFMASNEDFSAVLPDNISFDQLSYRYADASGFDQAPIQKGQNLSSLQVWYGSMCIAQTDVFAMNDVPVAYPKLVSVSHPSESFSWWWIPVLLIGIIAVVSIVYLHFARGPVRMSRNRKRRRRF